MTQALIIFRPNKVNVLSTNLLLWLKSKLRSAGWKSEYNLSNVKWYFNRLFLWCTTAVQKNGFQRIHVLKLILHPQALWMCDVKTLTSILFVCTWILRCFGKQVWSPLLKQTLVILLILAATEKQVSVCLCWKYFNCAAQKSLMPCYIV